MDVSAAIRNLRQIRDDSATPMHVAAMIDQALVEYLGVRELTDSDGTLWLYDEAANTYQPISPDGDASVPMPAIVFQHAYPELVRQFHPELT